MIIHVAVAVIENNDGQILVARRGLDVHQGGKWEFPGGKVEAGETVEHALVRELQEEINITPTQYSSLMKIKYDYPDKSVLLDIWKVTQFNGNAKGNEGQPIKWLSPSELNSEAFPSANAPIIKILQLPSNYVITPKFSGGNAKFLLALENTLKSGVRLIQLRDTELNEDKYIQVAHQVTELCDLYDAKLLLNNKPELCDVIRAAGVHLKSNMLFEYSSRPIAKDKWLSAACHSLDEIHHAQDIDVDFILLSPVLDTLSHLSTEPLGWENFAALCKEATVPVYALGGLKPADLAKAKQCGAHGVAGISNFWNV